MSKEYRIYANNKLRNICSNPFTLGCNIHTYIEMFGKNNVVVKEMESVIDEEKRKWLNSLSKLKEVK